MKHIFYLIIAILAMASFSASAKGNNESYNMRRALECVQDREFDKALEYVKRETAENPKNAEAFDVMGYIYWINSENDRALAAFGNALKLYPKKEKFGIARSSFYRGKVHLEFKDTISAISDFEMAVKNRPDDDDYTEELANLYFLTGRYSDADAVYRKMSMKDPGDPFPYYGLARTATKEGRYDDTRSFVEKSRALDPLSAMPDILLMRMYKKQKDHNGVLNAAIAALKKNIKDEEAAYSVLFVSDSIYEPTVSALRKVAFEDKDNKGIWTWLLGTVHRNHRDFDEAITVFEGLVKDSDLSSAAISSLIDCYREVDNFEKVEELAAWKQGVNSKTSTHQSHEKILW